MTEDEYLERGESEEPLLNLLSKCESAYRDGSLKMQLFSEEEFELLINHYMDEIEEDVVYILASMAYEQHPYSGELIIRYADALIVNNEQDKAIELLTEQLGYDSCDSDIYLLLARAYARKGEPEDAFYYAKKAVLFTIDESPSYYWVSIAQEYLELYDYNNALLCYRNAETFTPGSSSIIYDLAYILEQTGQLEESISYYKKYIDNDPFNDNVWLNLGTIYAKQNNCEPAIEAFDYAYALNPASSSALYNKGILLINNDKFAEAQDTLKDFIILEPDSYTSFISIAEALILKEQYNRALTYIRIVASEFREGYEHFTGLLESAAVKSGNPEIQLYYIVALYRADNLRLIDENIDILMKHNDTIWLDHLLELLPNLRYNERIIHYIEK